jgi:hypothetical protein
MTPSRRSRSARTSSLRPTSTPKCSSASEAVLRRTHRRAVPAQDPAARSCRGSSSQLERVVRRLVGTLPIIAQSESQGRRTQRRHEARTASGRGARVRAQQLLDRSRTRAPASAWRTSSLAFCRSSRSPAVVRRRTVACATACPIDVSARRTAGHAAWPEMPWKRAGRASCRCADGPQRAWRRQRTTITLDNDLLAEAQRAQDVGRLHGHQVRCCKRPGADHFLRPGPGQPGVDQLSDDPRRIDDDAQRRSTLECVPPSGVTGVDLGPGVCRSGTEVGHRVRLCEKRPSTS